MFDGRHCTREDLLQLIKETNRIKLFLLQKDEDVDRLLNRYLLYVERFDRDIADKMRRQISESPQDYERIIKIITSGFEVLEQNILVDINEHN